jgi:DNA repair exonuclease SbcCD nuclease subunit
LGQVIKPIAVMISDIHFTINTLEEASAVFLKAQFKAKTLGVPIVVAGDLLDAKAIMRAECVNRIIDLVSAKDAPDMIFLVGNHDKINEKSDSHSLNFLKPYAVVIDKPTQGHLSGKDVMFMPYQHDRKVIKRILDDEENPPPNILIMHQGVMGSSAGHYIQDRSACPKEWFANYRVISGHYHERQDIKCGAPQKCCVGLWSYLGNPYTLSFAESNDPEKGFQILNDDGSMEFEPTNLRKHYIIELSYADSNFTLKSDKRNEIYPADLVWVKVYGNQEDLQNATKELVRDYIARKDFKLEFIPQESTTDKNIELKSKNKEQVLDELIDSLTNVSVGQKQRLKSIWRDFA